MKNNRHGRLLGMALLLIGLGIALSHDALGHGMCFFFREACFFFGGMTFANWLLSVLAEKP